MTHELNMMDFVIDLHNKAVESNKNNPGWDYTFEFETSIRHARFLDSPPLLGDFVATNEEGEVMEKPKSTFDGTHSVKQISASIDYKKQMKEFQSALDRVKWKGWEVEELTTYIDGTMPGYILTEPHNSDEVYQNLLMRAWIEWRIKDGVLWLISSNEDKNGYIVQKTFKTYDQLIISGVKLERIEKK